MATNFCLDHHACTVAQAKTWEVNSTSHYALCCKNGNDGLSYGESSGGNVAEERWAHTLPNLHIPSIIKGITWHNNRGSRDCPSEAGMGGDGSDIEMTSNENSQ